MESGGWKRRLAKAAGAEPAGQMSKEKVHAVVARSIFPRQNGQTAEERTLVGVERGRFGAKLILTSKCTKHIILGPLFGS